MAMLAISAFTLLLFRQQNNVLSLESGQKPLLYTLDEAPKLFEFFINEYNKNYEAKEKEERLKVFMENLKEINSLNAKSTNAIYGINKFSDLTKEEFLNHHTGYRREISWNVDNEELEDFECTNFTAPDEFDWRSKKVVSDVKDQGGCGSCWAFSATGNVESINAIKTGNIIYVSEQQVLDCDNSCFSCFGGLPWLALSYLAKYGAIPSKFYPYEGYIIPMPCRYNSKQVAIKLKGFKHMKNVTEGEIKEHLYNIGPLSIGLAAEVLQCYDSGIIMKECHKSKDINHAVLLVGYGKENGTDYWIVKNSWGKQWGEHGYFRMQRGVNCLLLAHDGISTAIM